MFTEKILLDPQIPTLTKEILDFRKNFTEESPPDLSKNFSHWFGYGIGSELPLFGEVRILAIPIYMFVCDTVCNLKS